MQRNRKNSQNKLVISWKTKKGNTYRRLISVYNYLITNLYNYISNGTGGSMAKALDSESGDQSSNPSPAFNLGFFPQIIGNYPFLCFPTRSQRPFCFRLFYLLWLLLLLIIYLLVSVNHLKIWRFLDIVPEA